MQNKNTNLKIPGYCFVIIMTATFLVDRVNSIMNNKFSIVIPLREHSLDFCFDDLCLEQLEEA